MNKIKIILGAFIAGASIALLLAVVYSATSAGLGKSVYSGFTWDAVTNPLPYTENQVVYSLHETISDVQVNMIAGMEMTNTSTPNYHHYMVDSANLNIYRMGDQYVSFGKNVGVGTGTSTPSSTLHIIDTKEQLRLGYDSANYMDFVVDSNGSLALAADLLFLDNNNLRIGIGTTTPTAALEIEDNIEQFRIGQDASNYVSFGVATDGSLSITSTGAGDVITFNNAVDINDDLLIIGTNTSTIEIGETGNNGCIVFEGVDGYSQYITVSKATMTISTTTPCN